MSNKQTHYLLDYDDLQYLVLIVETIIKKKIKKKSICLPLYCITFGVLFSFFFFCLTQAMNPMHG